jgi:hypothetical protein
MRKAVLGVAIGLVALGGPLVGVASAGKLTCTTAYYGQTINSNVVVPSGNTCNLQGSRVKGSVTVEPGGRLVVGGTSRVEGSIASKKAGSDTTTDPMGNGQSFSVVICNTKVSGDVTITQSIDRVVVGGGPCGGNAILGAVELTANTGGVELVGNAPQAESGACPIEDPRPPVGFGLDTPCRIDGNTKVSNNSGSIDPPYSGASESAAVGYNNIGGNLNCVGNANGVTDIAVSSDSNTVAGSKSGQCAVL